MMPLSEIFFLAIVLWLLYRFFFNFLLPVIRTTKQVRDQFRNMHNQNPGGSAPFQNSHTRPFEEPQPKKKDPGASQNKMGEYIDFEEIK